MALLYHLKVFYVYTIGYSPRGFQGDLKEEDGGQCEVKTTLHFQFQFKKILDTYLPPFTVYIIFLIPEPQPTVADDEPAESWDKEDEIVDSWEDIEAPEMPVPVKVCSLRKQISTNIIQY